MLAGEVHVVFDVIGGNVIERSAPLIRVRSGAVSVKSAGGAVSILPHHQTGF